MSEAFDDELTPEEEERWCAEQRRLIGERLASERVVHGEIADGPEWYVAGVVGIWAVQDYTEPQYVGWWAIAGDLPVDYVSAQENDDPRAAMRAFGARWREQADGLLRGEAPEGVKVGAPEEWKEFGEMLAARADTLLEWADDDALWSD